jgi:hypothetical protein
LSYFFPAVTNSKTIGVSKTDKGFGFVLFAVFLYCLIAIPEYPCKKKYEEYRQRAL